MTKAFDKEDQRIADEVAQKVSQIADNSPSENFFRSQILKQIPEISQVRCKGQTPSGGINFTLTLSYQVIGEQKMRTRKISLTRKFPEN